MMMMRLTDIPLPQSTTLLLAFVCMFVLLFVLALLPDTTELIPYTGLVLAHTAACGVYWKWLKMRNQENVGSNPEAGKVGPRPEAGKWKTGSFASVHFPAVKFGPSFPGPAFSRYCYFVVCHYLVMQTQRPVYCFVSVERATMRR